MKDCLNLNFNGYIHNKSLWTGDCDCSHRRRIDFRKLLNGTLVCIEVDENQHSSYTDEEIRYNDIMMVHGGNIIFIRFNPDRYKINGKVINKDIRERLEILRNTVERIEIDLENSVNFGLFTIRKLFYDE